MAGEGTPVTLEDARAGIGSMVANGVFEPASTYLDTPTYGLAPAESVAAVAAALDEWREGTANMDAYDGAVNRSRQLFARIVDAPVSSVAVGAQVSAMVGPVAASVADGATVLAPEGDFTSLLFPFLVQAHRGVTVRTVPLEHLADAVAPDVDVVAFSLVQSSSGRMVDAEAVRVAAADHGALTVVDATHAAGWLPFSAADFDVAVAAAYKWLLCPRGAAFATFRAEVMDRITPVNAGWYAGEEPWNTIYGTPLRLAASARRFDISPAWFSWVGAVPSLELLASLGVEAIHDHNVGLASALRSALDLEPSGSAIVKLEGVDPSRLSGAGITAAVRADSIRTGCHVYNTSADVDALVDALAG